ncbi:MAG: hypothetical protein H7Y22_16305 [Gemmatimonadaceae bacterium]|nr:hypothetical protein [Gloeobacterales cyanobacterium ES-bin-141]
MSDTSISSDLDQTIAALQGGLTSIPPETAVAVIESWQQKLQGTDLADDLGQLKAALSGGSASASVSSLLSDLGEDTTETASSASGDVASKLQQLGQLLSQAGTSLM